MGYKKKTQDSLRKNRANCNYYLLCKLLRKTLHAPQKTQMDFFAMKSACKLFLASSRRRK